MVPVLNENKEPLMPTTWKRAKKLMSKGEAKPYWNKGIFCIILQRPPKSTYKQEICIGIDPGSKWNGYSIKSEAQTFLNLQVDAVTTVKKKIEEKSMLRRGRRLRKTPYRKCRFNRSKINWIAPSTRARWQQHLNIVRWMNKIFNITYVAVEDIKAKTIKGARQWNVNFSPLEVGKNWFYNEIEKDYSLYLFKGFDTYNMRLRYNFKKNSDKSKKDFFTHAMDAWCIANEVIGGHTTIDNKTTLYLKPLMYHRRKLHEILPKNKNYRRLYGGTLSLEFKRGTLVKHPKWGLSLIGGTSKGKISLHCLNGNKRLCQNAKSDQINIKTNLKYFKDDF